MARSLNKVQLIGRLGRDPEVRRLGNGTPVTNLRIATSESWKDKATQEWKEKTEWHAVVLFGEGLEKVASSLTKGSNVFVEGQLQTRKWTDNAGVEKYTTEIVLQGMGGQIIPLDGKPSEGNGRAASSEGGSGSSRGSGRAYDLDDNLPFAPEFR